MSKVLIELLQGSYGCKFLNSVHVPKIMKIGWQ